MEELKSNKKKLLITIDGPAGAGKTTVSRMLAKRLGYRYIDTGALYRGVAHAVREKGVSIEDGPELAALLGGLTLNVVHEPGKGLRLLSNGVDITDRIRTPEITMLASDVSARPMVREFLLGSQRSLGKEKGAVFEGRDMGTVVFPNADVKFFLDASQETRAMRRFKELNEENAQSLSDVALHMRKRDKQDSERSVAPLRPAPDAVMIDSSQMTVDDVVDHMLSRIQNISG
jgi:cytidylate kinase